MKSIQLSKTLVVLAIVASTSSIAQGVNTNTKNNDKTIVLKTYVIEREIPNAGKLGLEKLKGISQKSNKVIAEMGPNIKWLHSYVTDDKVYCVYQAKNKESIEKHAQKGGFPVNNIQELSVKIDPKTANN